MRILKFVSTPHIEGSRRQLGDSLDDLPLTQARGRDWVLEEKLDGSNSGISFDESGNLLLQSRGHYLSGGPRERHFALMKTWAVTHSARFLEAISDRYVVYGEWLYAKHTLFYDALPAYFLEFDAWDRQTGRFLSTRARRELLSGLPLVPAPIVDRCTIRSSKDIEKRLSTSKYRTPGWRGALQQAIEDSGSRPDMVASQTDMNDLAEGLYLKHENDDTVLDRAKFVRSGFIQTLNDGDGHWHSRPIIVNRLAPGVDIFAYETGIAGAYDDPAA